MKKINKRDIMEGIGFIIVVVSIITMILVIKETYELRSEVKEVLKITNRK